MDEDIFSKISSCIFSGDLREMENYTRLALETGIAPIRIIDKGLIPGMEKLGQDFAIGEIFLPELLIGADAMKTSLALIKPLLKSEDIQSKTTILIGTVWGDVHDIGKNVVAWMMEGAGFNVIDLGVDVAPEKFIEIVALKTPQILALSALLTTSAPQIETVIDLLREKGLRDNLKVIIGGACINQAYADRVGADGYALDAVKAVSLVRELLDSHTQEAPV
jgi:5-methyltetrahydrofolate--homocysteine methyltransferase